MIEELGLGFRKTSLKRSVSRRGGIGKDTKGLEVVSPT